MKHLLSLSVAITTAVAGLNPSASAAAHGFSGHSGGFSGHMGGGAFHAPAFSSSVRSFSSVPRTAIPTPAFAAETVRTPLPAAHVAQPVVRNNGSNPAFHGTWQGDATRNFHRDWDGHRDAYWNHHHYRWLGNRWVIIDDGFGYPYYDLDDGYYGAPPPDAYAMTVPDVPGNSLLTDAQRVLASQGYYHGPIDGEAGPQTRYAIAAFQRSHHLPATGTLSAGTLASMGLD